MAAPPSQPAGGVGPRAALLAALLLLPAITDLPAGAAAARRQRREQRGGGGGGGGGDLETEAEAEAEKDWRGFHAANAADSRPQDGRIGWPPKAVRRLERCLKLQPGHADCSFWRGLDLLQRGGQVGGQAHQLFSTAAYQTGSGSSSSSQLRSATRLEALYFAATVARQAGNLNEADSSFLAITELPAEEAGAGLPFALVALAMQRRAAGDWPATLAMAERGLEAAAAGVGPSGRALSQKVILEPAEAVAKLHDLAGFAKAMLAGGSPVVAANHFAGVVRQHFRSMPRPARFEAVGLFGLTLAHLRLARESDSRATSSAAASRSVHDGSSGWHQAATRSPEAEAAAEGRCDIDVVQCPGKDWAGFLAKYVDGNRPVLLRGLLREAAKCVGGGGSGGGSTGWTWPAREAWRRPALLEKYGATEVLARRSSATAAEYKQARGSGALASTMTLAHYLEAIRGGAPGSASPATEVDEDPLYLFEPVVLPGARGTDYQTLLPLFNDSRRFPTFDLRESANQIFAGGTDSGVGWHQHSPAYNALLFGARRWGLVPPFFYPTNSLVPDSMALPPKDWWAADPAGRTPHLLECVQRQDDVLFVPDRWWHATLTLQESIGVAQQLGDRQAGIFEANMAALGVKLY
eukprot:SAG22_NODE_923_length_6484_cov_4.127800_2_plen_636_part_00